MSTTHQAKIVLGYYSKDLQEELTEYCFDATHEGKTYEFENSTEGEVFGITILVTEWATLIDVQKLQFSPELITFVKKTCETEIDPVLILAWDKY